MTLLSSPVVAFVMVVVFFCGLLFALFQPVLAQGRMVRRRIQLAVGPQTGTTGRPETTGSAEAKRRRRSIDDTVRDMAEKQQKAQTAIHVRPTLASRMRQGGLTMTASAYWAICVLTGLIAGIVFWFGLSLGVFPAVGFGLACGLYLPNLYVNIRRKRRFAKFAAEFPNAVDVIVRGVKAGMPLGDCLRVVAAEGQEPVRSEFKTVIDDQTIGMPLDEAVMRLAVSVPLPETNFLAIVVTIQSRAGGNLAEALGNLSIVLRERKKMRGKIKSMSSEAKSSGWIIGALPVVVGTLVYFTSPDYISLLFTTSAGNIALAVCALWMGTGVLVMRKMINFDF